MALTADKIAAMDKASGLTTDPSVANATVNTPGKSRADEIRDLAASTGYSPELQRNIDRSQANNPIQNFSEGLAKGGLSTLKGIGSLGQGFLDQTAGRVVDALDGKSFTPTSENNIYNSESEMGKKANDVLKPEGTAQNIGNYAEKAAELIIPAGRAAKLADGITLLKTGAEDGALLKAGKVFVNSLPKTTANTLTTLGVVSAQDGEVDQNAVVSSLLSGGLDLGMAGTKALLTAGGPGISERLINSMIKPLKNNLSYGKNPGRGVAQEGIVATSLDDLGEKIGERLSFRVGQLGDMLQKFTDEGKTLDLSRAVKPIDDAIAEAEKAPNTNKEIIGRLQGLRDDLLGVERDAEGNVINSRNMVKLTPNDAVDYKRFIGKLTKFTGNPSDDAAVNGALKRVYGEVKGAIEGLDPENNSLKQLNERIADLISAKSATDYRGLINERQNMVGFSDTIVGGLGALSGAFEGGTPVAILTGMGALAFKKALSSPLVKTSVAKWLVDTAPAEKAALFKAVPWAKNAIIEGVAGAGEEGITTKKPK